MNAGHCKALCSLLAGCVLIAATSSADPGVYLGAGVGQTQIDQPADEEQTDFDETATGFKALVGYRPTSYLGIELAYADGGTIKNVESTAIDTVEVKLKTTSFSASILPTLPIGDRVSLFARAGYSWYDAEVTLASARFPQASLVPV